ncbi:MAG: hypothetical protein H7326_09980 [Bdellovibrionaceae bacterium]|nr:hypothetical protein [Pseudobdellovibrionaceae bacterium]
MRATFKPQFVISTLAMSVLLTLAACGEKKEVSPRGNDDAAKAAPKAGAPDKSKGSATEGGDDSEGTPKSRQPAPTDAPTNPSSDDSLPLPPPTAPGKDNGPGLPPPPGAPTVPNTPPPAQQPAPVPEPEQPPKLPPRPPTAATPRSQQPTPRPPVATQPPAPPRPPAPVPPSRPPVDQGGDSASNAGYDSEDKRNVDQSRFAKTYTGLKDEDGLNYVGASADNLLSYLRKNSDDSSVEAARNIVSARLTRVRGQVEIVIEMLEGNTSRSYTLGGYASDNRAIRLQVLQGNGARSIEGSLTCMDSDGGCDTSVGQFVIGDHRTRSAVKIIFRDSLADIHASLPGHRSGNPEYERVRAFWLNSSNDANTAEKLRDVYFNGFEVVNGRSGFDMQIVGENRQMLVIAGPLLAPRNGTATNLRADRSAAIPELNQYAHDIANSITGIRITNNNGLGQMKFQLKMRPVGDYEQDVFTLTVMRIVKPLRPLRDISL